MATHGSIDRANNSPMWVLAQVHKDPNTANRTALYGNTTANGFINGQTVAVVGIAANEMSGYKGAVASVGWQLKTIGSGGRAGRVFFETLVAINMGTDAVGESIIVISIQPGSKSVNTGLNTTFSVNAFVSPNAAITYQWLANTGSGFANLTNAGRYSNVTTQTLTIAPANSQVNQVSYQCLVQSTGAANVTSSNALLTVV